MKNAGTKTERKHEYKTEWLLNSEPGARRPLPLIRRMFAALLPRFQLRLSLSLQCVHRLSAGLRVSMFLFEFMVHYESSLAIRFVLLHWVIEWMRIISHVLHPYDTTACSEWLSGSGAHHAQPFSFELAVLSFAMAYPPTANAWHRSPGETFSPSLLLSVAYALRRAWHSHWLELSAFNTPLCFHIFVW